MLSFFQRKVIFVIFCLFLVVLTLLEFLLFLEIMAKGFTGATAVMSIIAGSTLGGCGIVFIKMLYANFIEPEILPISRLHRFASERREVSKNDQDDYSRRRSLVENTLQFAEQTLIGWIPGSHFELCVFVDAKQPLLFAYFDSSHSTNARSMSSRKNHPTYYIEKGYEVTKLLANPTSWPQVIGDTNAQDSDYVFATLQQRGQISSTLLLCLDLENPCALVLTSNSRSAMAESDPKFLAFIRFLAETIRYDLFDDGFIDRIRELKPDLFNEESSKAKQLINHQKNKIERRDSIMRDSARKTK